MHDRAERILQRQRATQNAVQPGRAADRKRRGGRRRTARAAARSEAGQGAEAQDILEEFCILSHFSLRLG